MKVYSSFNRVFLSDIGGHERIEAELLDGDTELGQLTLVGLNHVRVSLANLLQRGLDLADGIALEVLDLLQRRSDDAESLGLDSSSSQQLVNLGILRLETLLNGLVLLLENEVSYACLLMDFVDKLVELIEELFLLPLEVLVLLKSNFILPVDVSRDGVEVRNLGLSDL